MSLKKVYRFVVENEFKIRTDKALSLLVLEDTTILQSSTVEDTAQAKAREGNASPDLFTCG